MLVYYDLAPGQLMPNTWRILLGLRILSERHKVQFGLGCLLHNYYLKEHLIDTGRYSLVPRSKKKELIIDTKSNDKLWKDTFLFAKGPPVDGPWRMGGEEYQYQRVWNRYGKFFENCQVDCCYTCIVHMSYMFECFIRLCRG